MPLPGFSALAAAGVSAAAAIGLWQRYALLGHPRFKFRMPRAARAVLDLLVLTAANAGTATLAISQPRLILTVLSTLLSPAAKYGISYGSHPRQTLDVHAPMPGGTATSALLHPLPPQRPAHSPTVAVHPAVVFVHGGAWAFGDSWQYAAACRKAAQLGVVAVSVSYRVYPHGDAHDMADDVILALRYLITHAPQYHIDPRRITLVGHSAGAHLISMAQLRLAQAAAEHSAQSQVASATDGESTLPPLPIPASQAAQVLGSITGAVLKSGVYDIARHYDWEAHRTAAVCKHAALSPTFLACGGAEGAAGNSPALLVGSLSPAAAALLPPQVVTHSPWDETAPFDSAVQLMHAMRAAGVPRTYLVTPQHGLWEGHADVMVALMGGNMHAGSSASHGADLSKAYLQLLSAVVACEAPPGAMQHVPPLQRVRSEADLVRLRGEAAAAVQAEAKL